MPLTPPPRRRPRLDERLLLYAASRLTDRDRHILRLLAEHQVLTTSQVTDVAFDSVRRATVRLGELRRLRCVDAFRPRSPRVGSGSTPYHWVLDEAGAHICAAETGVTLAELGWRHDRVIRLTLAQDLDHLVGVNAFFTALTRVARRDPGRELVRWWSERRCAAEWGGLTRPDGHGIWAEHGKNLPLLLEYDRGTESLPRLTDKVAAYRRHPLLAADPATWVLIAVPSPRRETGVRRAIDPPVPVATAVYPDADTPAEPIWLPAGQTAPRLRLADLNTQRATPPTAGER